MKDQRLYEIRLANLRALITTECNDSKEEAARRIDTGGKNLERYLYGTRKLGDRVSRKIETGFRLKSGYLDIEHSSTNPVYFITVKVRGDLLDRFIRATSGIDEIIECSAVLGDFDAILKVEVEEFRFLEIVSGKISKMPGVLSTRTYNAIPTLRWQRSQDAGEFIYPHEDVFSNYLEQYIYDNILECLKEASQWESGEICISLRDNSQKLPIRRSDIYRSVKNKMLIVRKHTQEKEIDEELFEIEAQKINTGKLESKRIVILDINLDEKENSENYFLNNYKKLSALEKRFSSIGCEIKFISSSKFIPTRLSINYEHFIIIDDEYVMVVRSGQGKLYFKKDEQYVKMYRHSFYGSWDEASSLKEIEEGIFG